ASATPVRRLVAPGPRVAIATATRPVSLPWTSAMNAAPRAWRVVTCRISGRRDRASRTSIVSSPGTEKTYSQPSAARHSTSRAAAVRGRPSVMTGSLAAHTGPMTEPALGALLRLAAFTTDPAGGNPAGVWIGASLPVDAEMQRIAAEVGYSETAFIAP